MKQVTKEGYKELVNDYWKKVFEAEKSLSKEELETFKREEFQKLNHYEIILKHQPSHSNPKINELINQFCIDSREKNPQCTLYTGTAGGVSSFKKMDDSYRPMIPQHNMLEIGFIYQPNWSSRYREVYTSDENFATLSITEGDLTISLHGTKEDYDREIKESEEFYLKYH